MLNFQIHIEELSEIYCAVYEIRETLSKVDAIAALHKMSDSEIHPAMHLYGQLLWEGVSVEKNESKAFELISSVVAMGYKPALESLGGMYLVGAGCGKSFERAFELYSEHKALALIPAHNVWLSDICLRKHEFVFSLSYKQNLEVFNVPMFVLEKINMWRLDVKKQIAKKHYEMSDAQLIAIGLRNRRRLPHLIHGYSVKKFRNYVEGKVVNVGLYAEYPKMKITVEVPSYEIRLE